MKSASKSLADDMATDLFSDGTGDSKGFVGLAAAIDDGTNVDTYGGIKRTTDGDPWWKSYYLTQASDFTLANLRTAYAAVRVGADVPSLMVSDTTEQSAYEDIFLGTTNTLWMSTMVPKTLEGGFESYTFKGTPWVEDSHMSAKRIYFMNEKYLHFRPLMDFTNKGWQRPVDKDELITLV